MRTWVVQDLDNNGLYGYYDKLWKAKNILQILDRDAKEYKSSK